MKTIKLLPFLSLFPFLIYAQSVKLSVSPKTQQATPGDTLVYDLNISSENFNKQVFLSVVSENVPVNSKITFSETIFSYPYSVAKMSVTIPEGNPSGNYKIIIKAGNGPLVSIDTCYLSVKSNECHWDIVNLQETKNEYNNPIVIDHNSIIWYKTENRIVKQSQDGETKYYFSSKQITKITLSPENQIWGITTGGIFKIENDQLIEYTPENSSLPTNQINDLEFYKGKVYLGTSMGLIEKDEEFWTAYTISNSKLPENIIIQLQKDHKGNLCILTGKRVGDNLLTTLCIFNGENISNLELPAVAKNGDFLSISGFDFDIKNNLWLYKDFSRSFSIMKVTDSTSEMWGDGYYVPYGYLKMTTKGDTLEKSKGFKVYEFFMNSILATSDGDVWLCWSTGDQGEIYRFKENELITYNSKNSNIPNKYYSGLFEDSRGQVYISGSTNGADRNISYLNCGNQTITSFNKETSEIKDIAYPNPVSDELNVKTESFDNTANSIYLKDAFGKILYSDFSDNINNSSDLKINMATYLPGMYFLEIKGEGKSKTQKIIKY